jgi:hypothetical protein
MPYSLHHKAVSEFLGMAITIYTGESALANELLPSTKGHGMGWGWTVFTFGFAFFIPLCEPLCQAWTWMVFVTLLSSSRAGSPSTAVCAGAVPVKQRQANTARTLSRRTHILCMLSAAAWRPSNW